MTTETKKIERPVDLLSTASSSACNHDGNDSEITLTNERNVLTSYDYIAKPMQIDGVESEFSMLTCSDSGLPVGVPFKDTYNVLGTGAFLRIIESICGVLDNMGIKWNIETTGTLKNRGRMFVAIRLQEMSEFKVGDRVFHAFLNALNSVDKSCAVTFANNTFCVCCANTFAQALRGSEDSPFHAKVKHTKEMGNTLKDIPVLVEAWISDNDKLFKKLNSFHAFPFTLEQAENVFAAFLAGQDPGTILKVRNLNIVDKLKNLFARGAGNNGETALDVFSAVTDYYSHYSAGGDDEQKQFESSEIGDGANKKNEFFEMLSLMTDSTERFNGIAKVGQHVLIASRKALDSR